VKPALLIGTRGSALALWQARTVADRLAARGVATEIVVIRTSGDRLQDRPLSEDGGKRLFVKEIEEALLSGRVDIAVHSAKDMPSDDLPSLEIAAALPREDPRDALVLPVGSGTLTFTAALERLPARITIGTGSVRRIAQISQLADHARFLPVRGNVDTRLRKLDAGEFDAIVLAAAGLKRLGFTARISALIDVEDCVPAPGQGIVAIQIRRDDRRSATAVSALNDADALVALVAERTVVAALGGGCQLPLGAFAVAGTTGLDMRVMVASLDGRRTIVRPGTGPRSHPAALGRRLADELIHAGALQILDEVRVGL
jgi:hydroxymethylbilane synthase